MFELLLKTIEEKVSATAAELEIIQSYFSPRKLGRRQFLLREGELCHQLAFIEKGALYSYSTDGKGNQHVIQFAFEGWWIADLYSFFTREPTQLHVEALEDSDLLLIDRRQHQQLLTQVASFESYTRILYQNAYVALQRRIGGTIGFTAEERYARLLEQHPGILTRLPLHLIASYLGVTPETLSRIRKQMAR